MSDEKMKVKDLATELGQDPKDLLAACKELGFAAKSASTLLKPDEISKIKARASAKADAARESNIKVRRRSQEPAAAVSEPAAEQANATPGAAPSDDKPAEKSARPPKTGHEDAEKASGGKDGRRKPAASPEPAGARIISKPGSEAAPAAAPASPVAEAKAGAAAPEKAKSETARPVQAKADARPTERQEAASSAAPARHNAPILSAEPERDASGQAVSSAPASMPPRAPAHDFEEGGAHDDASDAVEGESEEDRKNRKKKKPRRDEAPAPPQVRVISRPDPSAPKPEQPARTGQRPGGGQGGYQPRPGGGGQGYDPNRAPRPAGAGGPGGQGGYQPRPGGGQGYDPNRAPRPAGAGGPGGYQPRPGGGQGYDPNRAPRPAGAGGPGGQGGYQPRPGGAPGGYQPRPGGTGGPGGPGGPGRPPATGAPRGPGGFAGAPGSESEQSKKKRQKGKRTVDFSDDFSKKKRELEGEDSHFGRRPRGKRREPVKPVATQPTKAIKRKIKVDEFIRVADLAHQMGLKSNEIIKVLFGLGIMATINQTMDIETATVVAAEFDYEVEKVGFSEDNALVDEIKDSDENLITRPPVITIMGHVDHGKTSLLDAIRKATVASGEAGGITQHIGAYHVTTKKGEIVFLDTPGHEAFTAMRARGAQVTDIVVLVVAADDGVMEQTREAINHSKAAGVPIMVAVNKMDKEAADPERVKRELSDQGLMPEEWGGDTVFSYVSAKSRQGLDEFMELLALQAEVMELKANPNKLARGHIVESRLDKGRGALGTVLVQQGTLRVGDTFVCGVYSGKVRAMFDDQGKKVKEAGPSIPVEVQGFEGVPEAGEEFICLTDEKMARRIAETRGHKQREKDLAKESKVTLETFLARRPDDVETLNLNLVVKADVHGSLEAIIEALQKLATEKVKVQVIHSGTGAITETDVMLAAASSAIVIGFNVRPTAKVKDVAEHENVEVRFYDIIYKLVEEVRNAMEGMLAPVSKEVYLGQAEVRQVFSLPKAGMVAGSFITDGKLTRNSGIRLLRDGVVVHTGKIGTLKRFKDDVREVLKGYECGISIENYNDIKAGDIIEAFDTVEEAAKL